MKYLQMKIKQGSIIVFNTSLLILFSLQPAFSQELEVLSDNKKRTIDPSTTEISSQSEFHSPQPEVTSTSSTGKWLLYGGLAAAGVGILAVAIGSTGGDGDGDDTSLSDPNIPDVGPSISGKNWAGTLNIQDKDEPGTEGVTAVISQFSDAITITTSSTLAHGQYFTGYINSNGFLKVIDNATNQTWTTINGNATTNSIQLYDYVNNFSDYDTLFLVR